MMGGCVHHYLAFPHLVFTRIYFKDLLVGMPPGSVAFHKPALPYLCPHSTDVYSVSPVLLMYPAIKLNIYADVGV